MIPVHILSTFLSYGNYRPTCAAHPMCLKSGICCIMQHISSTSSFRVPVRSLAVLSILESTNRHSDSDLKGLFYAPHSPSLYRLQTLELSSEYIFRVSFLHTIADELRFLPKGNGIKRIKIGRVSFPGYAEGVRDWRKNESDWRALLDPLTPEAFPSLKTVSIDAHVTIVNGCSGPGTDRMLQDLHQLEVDFGDEGRHYVFKMFAREKHVFV